MPEGFSFYLGVGLSVLGLAYTLIVLLMREAPFDGQRRPYIFNGVALCILGVSLLAYEYAPRYLIWGLWAVAGYLAVQATRAVLASKDEPPRGSRP